MVSRSEIDMKRIRDEYKKTYGKTLHQEILVGKTSDHREWQKNPIPLSELLCSLWC